MSKIWQFEDNGIDMKEIYKLMMKYSRGLNSQQSSIRASVDVNVNYNADAEFTLKIDCKSNEIDIFKATTCLDGSIYLDTYFTTGQERVTGLTMTTLEELLNERIKDNRIGAIIAYYISVANR